MVKLIKSPNLTELSGSFVDLEQEDKIEKTINVYQAIFHKIEDWLTKQEKRFFIATIIIANKNLKYNSVEAKRIYQDVFNLKRQSDIRGYLKILEGKNFLRADKKTKKINLNEFFIMEPSSEEIRISLNFV